jgi:pimeloyl-ACP methyl ester carboxylesterase
MGLTLGPRAPVMLKPWRTSSWFARIASIGVMALVAVLAAGATYEQLMRVQARREFALAGRLVDVGGGRRLQLDCRGTGSPTVILESGLDHLGSLSWTLVHDSLAAQSRVCAYSRPGIMWSDPASGAFTTQSLARDLHAALLTSGETAPWVMVAHSIGGPYVTAFANEYDAEVVGFVFLDTSHPDQFPRFQAAVGKSVMPTPTLPRVGAALAWTGLVRLLTRRESPASWPASIRRAGPAFLPLSIVELRREVEALPSTMRAAAAHRSLGDRPLVVLTPELGQDSASLRTNGVTASEGRALQLVSQELTLDQSTWSRRGRRELVPGASHYIQFDRPDVVIRAVREVVQAVRQPTR